MVKQLKNLAKTMLKNGCTKWDAKLYLNLALKEIKQTNK